MGWNEIKRSPFKKVNDERYHITLIVRCSKIRTPNTYTNSSVPVPLFGTRQSLANLNLYIWGTHTLHPMTDIEYIRNLRTPSTEDPLRLLMSACFTGIVCGFDNQAYADYPTIIQLLKYDKIKVSRFCPEDFSFGTPRRLCDIHGGDGFDVLNGKAKVLTEEGDDWTAGMIEGAKKMLEVAQKNNVELCVLMDVSAACGSQVIYEGMRRAENPVYQVGAGVAAALLIRNGYKVISQRDYASMEALYHKLNPAHTVNPDAIDHLQHPWCKEHFGI